ncbi:MAG: TolB-like 6-bladed beta-propeller domain-containing protein [Prevotellaceae bacterium]|nr:TolB-like 6-bladed beta-propeller domain-containing protein [Prevotellaceae bacterium]
MSQSTVLGAPEIIFGFDDRYPVDIMVKDSIAILVEVKNNTSLIALNLEKKEILKYFGRHGKGPEDVLSPDFVPAASTGDFIFIHDYNLGKVMKIHLKGKDRFKMEKVEDYPKGSGGLSLSSGYDVYRTAELKGDAMFYIHNRTGDSTVNVDYYPEVKGLFAINTMLAPVLALNVPENRIMAGMYFIDMFSLYDLTGKRLKSVYFSDNYIPAIDENEQSFDLQKGYSSVKPYPTNDFCYFLRRTEANDEIKEAHLIQTDWNGNPVKSYIIPDSDIHGGFCIDETSKKMYTFKHSIIDDNEIFYLAAYSLH